MPTIARTPQKVPKALVILFSFFLLEIGNVPPSKVASTLNPEKLCWQFLPRPKKSIDFPFPLPPKLKIFRSPV